MEVLQLEEDAGSGQRRKGFRVGAGRLGDDAHEPGPGRLDVGGVDHARGDQNGSSGSSCEGDMNPTGISDGRAGPAHAPAPVHEDETALAAALLDQYAQRDLARVAGVADRFMMSSARRARVTRMMASPSPVHDTPPSVLSA